MSGNSIIPRHGEARGEARGGPERRDRPAGAGSGNVTRKVTVGGFKAGALLTLVLFCMWMPSPLKADAGGEISGLELTPQVRWQMRQLHESWQQWAKSFEAADGKESVYLDQMLERVKALGMQRLPDLAIAASAYAVRAAETGKLERAEVALTAARRLDDGRPEVDFAAARVAGSQGAWGNYLVYTWSGLRKKMAAPVEGALAYFNLRLWLLYTLLLSFGLYVAMMMMAEGGALFYDLARLLSPPLARRTADIVTVLILVWPIVLPSGFLWLALYWSVLLWAYATTRERAVLIFAWLVLGVAPSFVAQQQQALRLTLSPPIRLLENLRTERLYGAIFSDTEALVTMVPKNPAVTELVADIHRRLGQWDYARAIYTEISQDPDQSGAGSAIAYNNIGVYHHRRKEYETAITYFKRASEANPQLAQAHFNMGQSYAQLYDFNNSHAAMGQAKVISSDLVEQWNDRIKGVDPAEAVVAADGGLSRSKEVQRLLTELWSGRDRKSSFLDLWRRHSGLTAAVFALLLAIALGQARQQLGFRSTALDTTPRLLESPIARALLPGLDSANDDDGVGSILALLPAVGLGVLAFLCAVGYRSSIAFDPTCMLGMIAGLVPLAILLLIRWRLCAKG